MAERIAVVLLRLLAGALALAAAALPSGCALAAHGRTQAVTIHVEPASARVTVDGRPVEAGRVLLRRDRNHIVHAEAPGFESAGAAINTHSDIGWCVADGAFAASGLAFFYIGAVVTCVPLVVDAATGALDELDPEEVVLRLQPLRPPAAAIALAPTGPPPAPAAGPPPRAAAPPPVALASATAPQAGALEVYCPACGVPFETGHRYCAWCGRARTTITPMRAGAATEPTAATAPAPAIAPAPSAAPATR
jgi:hypothetical protein